MISFDESELREFFGFGVAGNFAGHLEQAGEAADFYKLPDDGAEAPKGIFPFYVPGESSFLGAFPISHDRIALPPSDEPLNLQIEPELGLVCDVEYLPTGEVGTLAPVAAGAFNDCSIRRPGAKKISEKKNWGPNSKGFAARLIPVGDLGPDGPTKSLRIASFLRRAEQTHAYGIDSAVAGYSYFGEQLLNWIAERLNNQQGDPDTPLESVGEYLAAAGQPRRVVIGVGATRYTELGETTYLQAGDESIVVVYDGELHRPQAVEAAIAERRHEDLPGASILEQRAYESAG